MSLLWGKKWASTYETTLCHHRLQEHIRLECHHNPCAHIRLHIFIKFLLHISGCILSSHSVCIYQVVYCHHIPFVYVYQAAYCHHIPCAHIRLYIVFTFRVHTSGCILSSHSVGIYQAAYFYHIPCSHIRLHVVITFRLHTYIRLRIVITFRVHISGCILSSHSLCTYQVVFVITFCVLMLSFLTTTTRNKSPNYIILNNIIAFQEYFELCKLQNLSLHNSAVFLILSYSSQLFCNSVSSFPSELHGSFLKSTKQDTEQHIESP
jgi:hypothetical protein